MKGQRGMFFLFLEKYANEVVAPNAIEKMATAMIKKKKNLHQLLQVQIVCLSWKSRLHSGTQTSESLGFKQRLSLISFHIGKMRKCHTVHI